MTQKVLPLPILRFGKGLLFSLVLLSVWPAAAGTKQIGQTPGPVPGGGHPQRPGVIGDEPSPVSGSTSMKMEHMREDERRKRMLSDTAKLVALSTELNAEVEKTAKDELSVEVVRKAAEIEKLAHDVRERMRS
ncbi:MAG: hypothetical protein ACRYFU_20070 [Janthinobacterium lividum]